MLEKKTLFTFQNQNLRHNQGGWRRCHHWMEQVSRANHILFVPRKPGRKSREREKKKVGSHTSKKMVVLSSTRMFLAWKSVNFSIQVLKNLQIGGGGGSPFIFGEREGCFFCRQEFAREAWNLPEWKLRTLKTAFFEYRVKKQATCWREYLRLLKRRRRRVDATEEREERTMEKRRSRKKEKCRSRQKKKKKSNNRLWRLIEK